MAITPIVIFLLFINQGDLSSAGRPGLFWVAADKAQCSAYSNGSDCDTLAGYQERKDVNFSLSDTTWIFLHGEHVGGTRSNLTIVGVRNVTLKGESICAMGAEECVLGPMFHRYNLQIHVEESSYVTLKHLRLQTSSVTVKHASNFCVSSVDFLSTSLVIQDPFGDYTIMGSSFSTKSHINTELSAYPCASEVSCNFTFTVKQCYLGMGEDPEGVDFPGFHIIIYNQTWYHSIEVVITNSTLDHSQLTVVGRNYPISSFSLKVNNVNFNWQGVNIELPLLEKATYLGLVDEWLGAHVLINNCNFMVGPSQAMVIHFWPNWFQDSPRRVVAQHPEVIISHSNFQHAHGTTTDYYVPPIHHFMYPYTLSAQITNDGHSVHEASHRPLLTILHTTFKRVSRGAALGLTNLQGYRVLLAEGNRMVSNGGFGLLLNNTKVEFQGYNEISTNTFTRGQMGGGIYLSSDSQLLLKPHSLLNVSANRGDPYGGGLYNDYKGRRVNTLNEFVDCYVDKLTCPGWCFFQFINSDGQYVNASDIAEHNATVILSNNTATLGGNSVFNGHFQNCSLQTAHGTLPASRELILSVFHQHPPMDDELIPSFPYAICLCDGDELNCIRNHTLVIETYPVQQPPILVTVLGDWQREIPVRLTVALTQLGTETKLDVKGCTELQVHPKAPAPGSWHELSLKASLMNSDAVLQKSIAIRVFNGCSPGLQYEHEQCECNPFLKRHSFTCTIVTNTTRYKAERPHYWIGIEEEQVTISSYCPLFFCNSVLQSGLAIHNKSDNNLQCNNGRQGLLCSECPSGYSSVLGSFKCKQCSSVWLLQLPLYAFGGIFIVAVLFLFNLTLLQGTIMGVVLHANIMGLMADFLREHAWGPLFFLLSLLIMQFGAGVCFYDGMDEFWVALLQFAFPFYLFTLLIVIIIITHKCGYRMFRKARFIARRAVPVLATIMLLTYTSLVNAVITPLRYTTLYDVDTARGKVVWLYQPSLPFFRGKHVVLGSMSIAVTLIYLIPFTFTMLFGDLMRRYFHKLWFSHFMDVLHGAFRWPLGFWIGLRLLIRVILVVIHICIKPSTSAFYTVVIAGILLVVQLLVKPFREPNFFGKDIHLQGPPTCKRKCLTWIKRFLNTYHAPLLDTLYLLNIVQTSAMVSFGTSSQMMVLSAAGSNILILLALAQFAVILFYHAYNFFPVPEKVRSCAQSCWLTMHAIPSMLKDTQCCQRRPSEEEEPRRSPTPILTLRPPEVNESYDSESETNSDNEQPPPEEVELRESSLQEPLLTNWY